MFHFFVKPEQIQGHTVVIEGSDVNHIKNVLRLKEGEEISVSNGQDSKEFRCMIGTFLSDRIECDLCFIKEDISELASRVYLFQSLPKSDKMELIIQKAVELGVHEIIPVAAARSVVKLDEKKSAAKGARWQAISEAAAKQCKRTLIPKVTKVLTVKEAMLYAKDMDLKLFPYEHADGMNHTREIMDRIPEGIQIAVFIGPEGGFDDGEVAAAEEAGFEIITLGKRILRTETAGMTVLSWMMYRLDRG